ncbi:hypothetical protein G7Z17_g2374 [Cylindrodendrum hubeiense]|uniref:Uncharacterized protein n=1 Tax=Cylindrodendrum hubeiense TaxID=595255 RepID=A0A9P5LL37_9HYPO|nr:hypothetical protein G7Z17_g2374 [Cylindrodendrum hubeiense]
MTTTLPTFAQEAAITNAQPAIFDKIEQELPIPPFDPAIHLNYQPPPARRSFTELGLPIPKGCPDICFTEPFQLFSEEGVRMIRREIFRKSFLDKYMRSWDRAPCLISGHHHSKQDGIFMKQACYHPVTQAAINSAFGCALQLQTGENDMGYINVQIGAEGIDGVYNMTEIPSKPLSASEAAPTSKYDNDMIDSWHKDQTPLVLVVMLSDTSTMVGGETAIKMGDGSIMKARGASIGGAVLMAGGYLEHAALRANNCSERLSFVNSYSYADPNADDTATTLKSVNFGFDNIANVKNVIMEQKLRRLRDRCDLALSAIQERRQINQPPTREEVEEWVKDQVQLLKHTSWEMFERLPNYHGQEIPEGILERYLTDV